MRLVVDTNVMVESITSRSPYYKLFQSFVQGKNEIVISNAILSSFQK
jgi:predicted nucleic acid-binding protein